MNWVNKFLLDLFDQAENFYKTEYFTNDIKNDVVKLLRKYTTEEVLDICLKTKSYEELRQIITEAIKPLCDKQKFAIQQHYFENKSFYDIYCENHPRFNSAYSAKLSVNAGLKTIIKNDVVCKVLLSKDLYEFMRIWETVPIVNRYADITDAKILELDLETRSKEALIRGLIVNAGVDKDPSRISISDTLDCIGDLNDVQNCGDKTICDIIRVYDSLGINTDAWKSKFSRKQLNLIKKVQSNDII